jgi:hypothetical protein
MAVTSTATSISYTGNGATTAFPVPFKFFASSDLVVTLTPPGGTSVLQALNTQYTVAGAGADSGGTLTTLTPPPSGAALTIQRSSPALQATAFGIVSTFSPKVHEATFDKIVLPVQETIARTSRLETRLTTVEATLSTSALGSVTVNNLAVSLDDFGAVGDGVTNDSAHVQAAATALGNAGGGTLWAGPKTYLVANVSIPANVILQGAGRGITVFKVAAGAGNVGLTVGDHSGIRDCTINFPAVAQAVTTALGTGNGSTTVFTGTLPSIPAALHLVTVLKAGRARCLG